MQFYELFENSVKHTIERLRDEPSPLDGRALETFIEISRRECRSIRRYLKGKARPSTQQLTDHAVHVSRKLVNAGEGLRRPDNPTPEQWCELKAWLDEVVPTIVIAQFKDEKGNALIPGTELFEVASAVSDEVRKAAHCIGLGRDPARGKGEGCSADNETNGKAVGPIPQFPNRASWLADRLRERAWNKHDLWRQGGPHHKTVQKILSGLAVREDILQKVVDGLSTRNGKVTVLDIPQD